MPAKTNTTMSADIAVAAREVDFASRFGNDIEILRDIMGAVRLEKKTPGTVIKSKYAEVTLAGGDVGEGEEIPYSKASVKTKDYAPIKFEKYKKGVTIEAITEHGYDAAVQLTDDQLLYSIEGDIVDRFIEYIQTGTLKSTEVNFQMALAMAQGRVRNKWKEMKKGISQVIGFCNILDAYAYLGASEITVQTQFGMNYIENFLGYSKLFLTSDIPTGTVVATPAENIVLNYIDPSDSDYAKAGLDFRTDGETNLVGVHIEGNYGTVVSEITAILGMVLFAEYLDGIAVISIQNSPTGD